MCEPSSNLPTTPGISRKDWTINTTRSLLQGIPYLGTSLDQFIFGHLEELRWQRVETTLREIATSPEQHKGEARVNTEEFVNLLESVLPRLSRSTSEETRKRFRDLLLNAATLPPESAEWGKATLAAQLLDELAAPALAILAAMAKYDGKRPLAVVSLPAPQLVNEEEYQEFGRKVPAMGAYAIHYEWPVVYEWIQRLRERRLIYFTSSSGHGGCGGLDLTDLGKMLVAWTIRDE